MGRNARGVKGITLLNDAVVGMTAVADGSVLTVTGLGYAKRTQFSEYSLHHRGGKGVITMRVTAKNGDVADMRAVTDTDEVLIISQQGKVIRIPVKSIRVMGRATMGVIAMSLDEADKVSAVTIVERD
jgi:DNA gyrase subunit A